MHNFWKDEQPEQRMNNMINFGKKSVACLVDDAARSAMQPWLKHRLTSYLNYV